jgi:hypothetical protein
MSLLYNAFIGGVGGFFIGNILIKEAKVFTRRFYRHCPLILHSEWEQVYYANALPETGLFYYEIIENSAFLETELARQLRYASHYDKKLLRIAALDLIMNNNPGGSGTSRVIDKIRKTFEELPQKPEGGLDELHRINESFKNMNVIEQMLWNMCVQDYRKLRYVKTPSDA